MSSTPCAPIDDIIPTNRLSRRFYIDGESQAHQAVALIREMVDLLVCEQLFVSAGVRECLTAELPMQLLPTMFAQMSDLMKHFQQDLLGETDANILQPFATWILQACQTTACILERFPSVALSHAEAEVADNLIQDFIKTAHSLDSCASPTLKIWAARLLFASDPARHTCLLSSIGLRRTLTSYLMTWTISSDVGLAFLGNYATEADVSPRSFQVYRWLA